MKKEGRRMQMENGVRTIENEDKRIDMQNEE